MALEKIFKKLIFKPEQDSIKVLKGKGKIHLNVSAINFIDKDTLQYVIYLPSLDISSYGSSFDKAEQMLFEAVDDFCKYLIKLKIEDIKRELRSLGWKQDTLHKKEFSNAHIDMDGNLRDFNAKDNKVSISRLQAA